MATGSASPGRVNPFGLELPRGCIWGFLLIGILVLAGAYLFWDIKGSLFSVPPELEPYATEESTLEQIESNAVPPDTLRVNQENLSFYIGSFDAINEGRDEVVRRLDSLMRREGGGRRADRIDFWDSRHAMKDFIQLPLRARAGLVRYLNAENRSWAEYQAIKERVVAASGISHQQVQEATREWMQEYFLLEDEEEITFDVGTHDTEDLFIRVRELKKAGVLSEEEIALVAPHRDLLLSKGLQSLLSVEDLYIEEPF